MGGLDLLIYKFILLSGRLKLPGFLCSDLPQNFPAEKSLPESYEDDLGTQAPTNIWAVDVM